MPRYYTISLPGQEPIGRTSVRDLRNLPEGTRVFWVITDSNGMLIDEKELDVIDGRVKFTSGNVRTPKIHRG